MLENQLLKLMLCMNFLFVREVKLDGCNQFCVRGTYTESASSHCESKSPEGLFQRVFVGTVMVTIIILLTNCTNCCNCKKWYVIILCQEPLSPKMIKINCLFR